MTKACQILRDYDTAEKLEYLKIKDNTDLMDQARVIQLNRELIKQAKKVLAGKCPCEREFLGHETLAFSPRSWMTYYKEVSVYGKCKFCGEF